MRLERDQFVLRNLYRISDTEIMVFAAISIATEQANYLQLNVRANVSVIGIANKILRL